MSDRHCCRNSLRTWPVCLGSSQEPLQYLTFPARIVPVITCHTSGSSPLIVNGKKWDEAAGRHPAWKRQIMPEPAILRVKNGRTAAIGLSAANGIITGCDHAFPIYDCLSAKITCSRTISSRTSSGRFISSGFRRWSATITVEGSV